ncbi:hypothetical protein [Streptomyces sp. NPDC005141]
MAAGDNPLRAAGLGGQASAPISPAGGRRRTHGQLALELGEYGRVEDAGWERTRATAYDVIRATEVHRYAAVLCENVLEFAVDWELFDWWRGGMELLGYRSQVVSVSSAHVGGGDNLPAPQWRDRIYITFTRTDVPVPDLTPSPLAYCTACGEDVGAVQIWRNGRRVGKYKQQGVRIGDRGARAAPAGREHGQAHPHRAEPAR